MFLDHFILSYPTIAPRDSDPTASQRGHPVLAQHEGPQQTAREADHIPVQRLHSARQAQEQQIL